MRVILRKDHEKLGHIGSVVDVKDGYARNFLIPRGIAYPASDGSVRALEEEKRQAERRTVKEKKTAEKLAGDLSNLSLTITMKAGEDDKLFGSVTSQMIADSLKDQGIEIDKRSVELEEPIKSLGVHDVNVRLAHGVSGVVKVWVVRE